MKLMIAITFFLALTLANAFPDNIVAAENTNTDFSNTEHEVAEAEMVTNRMSETLAGLRKIKFAWKKAMKKAGKKRLHKRKPHHRLWGRRRAHFVKRPSRKNARKKAGKKHLHKHKPHHSLWGRRRAHFRKNARKKAGKKAGNKAGKKHLHKPHHSLWGRRRRHHHLKTGNKKFLKGLSTGMKDRKAAKKKATEVEAKAASKMKVVNIKKMRRKEGTAKERVSKAKRREQAAKVRVKTARIRLKARMGKERMMKGKQTGWHKVKSWKKAIKKSLKRTSWLTGSKRERTTFHKVHVIKAS